MKRLIICKTILVCSLFISCIGQTNENRKNPVKTKSVGGPFENSEFIYYNIPKNITSVDTSLGWLQKGQRILVTGIVYQIDGKTPVPNVLLYYYHTDIHGKYLHKPEEKRSMPPNKLGQTDGYIRGWVKTDVNGRYSIYSVKPGIYPTHNEPAHIHMTVKEPNINEYYIDDFVFDDDLLLTGAKRKKMPNRCGSGVLRMLQKGDLLIGERNLILGLNIPNYPKKANTTRESGLNIGEDQPSFMPFHAFGPDKGTRTCPVCKYGRYHGIIYFVGNNSDWLEIKSWLKFLEQESERRKKYLKVYFVYGNNKNYNKNQRQAQLEKLGHELGLKNMALTFVPSFSDQDSETILNKINPEVKNTFIIYKNRNIVDKYIDLKATDENFKILSKSLDMTQGEYFNLPGLEHD